MYTPAPVNGQPNHFSSHSNNNFPNHHSSHLEKAQRSNANGEAIHLLWLILCQWEGGRFLPFDSLDLIRHIFFYFTLQCLPFSPSWTHQNQFVLSLADLTWPLRQSEGYKHSSSQRLKICYDHHLNRLIRLLMFWGAKKWIKCAINPYWCFLPHLASIQISGSIIQSYTTVCWHNLIHLFDIKLEAPPQGKTQLNPDILNMCFPYTML